MNETEILIEALGQVPELVEAAKTYKESNEKTISIMSTAIKKRPEAVIPQKEVDKVTDAVKATPCALPRKRSVFSPRRTDGQVISSGRSVRLG